MAMTSQNLLRFSSLRSSTFLNSAAASRLAFEHPPARSLSFRRLRSHIPSAPANSPRILNDTRTSGYRTCVSVGVKASGISRATAAVDPAKSQRGVAAAAGRVEAPSRDDVALTGDAAAAEGRQESSRGSARGAGAGEEEKWEVKLLYDGDCPICMREVNFLQERNAQYGTLKFVDISSDDYDPDDNAGVQYEEAMGHIHGIQRDGTILTGVEAFRKFYEVIGLGWVYAFTKIPLFGAIADAVYDVWAKYRLPLSGRPSLQAVMEERRRAKQGDEGCIPEKPCEVEW